MKLGWWQRMVLFLMVKNLYVIELFFTAPKPTKHVWKDKVVLRNKTDRQNQYLTYWDVYQVRKKSYNLIACKFSFPFSTCQRTEKWGKLRGSLTHRGQAQKLHMNDMNDNIYEFRWWFLMTFDDYYFLIICYIIAWTFSFINYHFEQ